MEPLLARDQAAIHGGDCGRNISALYRHFGWKGVPRGSLDSMAARLLKFLERVESRADESAQAQARRRHARVRDERSVLFDLGL